MKKIKINQLCFPVCLAIGGIIGYSLNNVVSGIAIGGIVGFILLFVVGYFMMPIM